MRTQSIQIIKRTTRLGLLDSHTNSAQPRQQSGLMPFLDPTLINPRNRNKGALGLDTNIFFSHYGGSAPFCFFQVGLGSQPLGPKAQQGDGKTSEGNCLIQEKRDRGRTDFYHGFYVAYPNQHDLQRARVGGVQKRLLNPVGHKVSTSSIGMQFAETVLERPQHVVAISRVGIKRKLFNDLCELH